MKNRWEEVLEVTDKLGEWEKTQSYRRVRYEDHIENGIFYRKFTKFGVDYRSEWKKTLKPIDPLRQQKLWKKDKELQYAFAVKDGYSPKIVDKEYNLVVIPEDISAEDAMACVVLQHLEGCRYSKVRKAIFCETPRRRLKEKLRGDLTSDIEFEKNHTEFNAELCWRELTRTKEQSPYETRLLKTFCGPEENNARLLAAQNTPGVEIVGKHDGGILTLRVPVFGWECCLQEGDLV